MVKPLFFKGKQKTDMDEWEYQLPSDDDDVDQSDKCDEAFGALSQYVSHLRLGSEKWRRAAHTDEVSGVGNRRFYNRFIKIEGNRIQRNGGSVAVVVFDIDYFKQINSLLGHDGGDAAIRWVCDLVRHSIRGIGQVARLGGVDEFAIILPDYSVRSAMKVMEGIRQILEDSPFQYGEHNIFITISGGIVGMPEDTNDPMQLFPIGSSYLLLAKERGRKRFVTLYNI